MVMRETNRNNLAIAEARTTLWAMGFEFSFTNRSFNPPTNKELEKFAAMDILREIPRKFVIKKYTGPIKDYDYFLDKKGLKRPTEIKMGWL